MKKSYTWRRYPIAVCLPMLLLAGPGIPAVQANYMDIDTMIEIYSQPWPLWTWWDKSLAPTQQPIPAFKD